MQSLLIFRVHFWDVVCGFFSLVSSAWNAVCSRQLPPLPPPRHFATHIKYFLYIAYYVCSNKYSYTYVI